MFLAEPLEGADNKLKMHADFDSCGAIWATAKEIKALDRTDYRANDPAYWIKMYTKGKLTCYEINNRAFQDFNRFAKELTPEKLEDLQVDKERVLQERFSGGRGKKNKAPLLSLTSEKIISSDEWQAFRKQYPSKIFLNSSDEFIDPAAPVYKSNLKCILS